MADQSWREQAMALFEGARDLTEEERDAYRAMRNRLSTPRGSSQQEEERTERERLADWLEGEADRFAAFVEPVNWNGASVEEIQVNARRIATLLRSSAQPSQMDVDALAREIQDAVLRHGV